MNLWAGLIAQITDPVDCTPKGKASGGKNPLYGKATPMVINSIKHLDEFIVPDVTKATGLSRTRVNRILSRLNIEGKAVPCRSKDAHGKTLPTIWRLK